LVKYTAALSIFFTGLATVNVPAATVHADDINTTTVNTDDSISDIETTTPAASSVKKTSAADQKRDAVVKLAKKQIGKPYIVGCNWSFRFRLLRFNYLRFKNSINKTLPRTTYGQITLGKAVSLSTKKLKKGDLLFWGNSHVAIYIGNGKYVHAPAPGQNVRIQTLGSFMPSSAKRVID
jgi:Cell wall-associated hydrolases (invasion-associated proteins)